MKLLSFILAVCCAQTLREAVKKLAQNANNPELKRFLLLLNNLPSETIDSLENYPDISVFAPSDNAMMIFPFENQRKSHDYFLYHVIQDFKRINFAGIQQVRHKFPTAMTHRSAPDHVGLLGSQVVVFEPSFPVTIDFGQPDRAKIITGPIDLKNGRLYIVDKILIPPQSSVKQASLFGLTLFSKLLEKYAIDYLPQVTIFAVKDARIESVTKGTFLYHIVEGQVLYKGDLTDGLVLHTLSGKSIHVRKQDDISFLNDVQIIQYDILMKNGVMHIVEEFFEKSDPMNDEQVVVKQGTFLKGFTKLGGFESSSLEQETDFGLCKFSNTTQQVDCQDKDCKLVGNCNEGVCAGVNSCLSVRDCTIFGDCKMGNCTVIGECKNKPEKVENAASKFTFSNNYAILLGFVAASVLLIIN